MRKLKKINNLGKHTIQAYTDCYCYCGSGCKQCSGSYPSSMNTSAFYSGQQATGQGIMAGKGQSGWYPC